MAFALALPAAAIGQVDPVGDAVGGVGQTVKQDVPQVHAPAPVQHLALPSAPTPAPSAGSQAPAPSRSGAGAGGSAGAGQSGSSSSAAPAAAAPASGAAADPPAGRQATSGSGTGKAHAASGNAAGADRVLGQQQDDGVAAAGDTGSFTAGAQPDTGVAGDSRLPFTGGYLLLFLALGAGAVAAGQALRSGSRLRLTRRHGH